jgi:hypothetical protein
VIYDKRNVIELEVDEDEKDDVVGALLIEKDVWMVEEVRYVYFVGEYNVKAKLLFFVLEHLYLMSFTFIFNHQHGFNIGVGSIVIPFI